jgi:hypothetical protein
MSTATDYPTGLLQGRGIAPEGAHRVESKPIHACTFMDLVIVLKLAMDYAAYCLDVINSEKLYNFLWDTLDFTKKDTSLYGIVYDAWTLLDCPEAEQKRTHMFNLLHGNLKCGRDHRYRQKANVARFDDLMVAMHAHMLHFSDEKHIVGLGTENSHLATTFAKKWAEKFGQVLAKFEEETNGDPFLPANIFRREVKQERRRQPEQPQLLSLPPPPVSGSVGPGYVLTTTKQGPLWVFCQMVLFPMYPVPLPQHQPVLPKEEKKEEEEDE